MEIMLDDVAERGEGRKRRRKMPTYTAQELAEIVNHHVHKHGGGFFGDLWDGIKKGFGTVMGVAKPILGMIPHPVAQGASKIMDSLGMGKTHKRRGRRTWGK
jgi:hypothetical protein